MLGYLYQDKDKYQNKRQEKRYREKTKRLSNNHTAQPFNQKLKLNQQASRKGFSKISIPRLYHELGILTRRRALPLKNGVYNRIT